MRFFAGLLGTVLVLLVPALLWFVNRMLLPGR